ncbi:MAG TPA: substrate-binding domain-containing protein [Solirubrobacteraceae bacterium]|nr:substrate-binding domain-containing protein [Solirubrobacteraceae bacterium]
MLALTCAATAACAGVAVSGASAATSASAGLAHAQQVVKQYSAKTTTYPTPTKPITHIAKAKGKTVMYIPLVPIAAFSIIGSSMKTALAHAGVKTTICNGEATPTSIENCINQAVSAHDAGIVTDSIPYQLAADAFQSASKAGVNVLITDQEGVAGTAGKHLAYLPGDINEPTLMADWIIADSKGKAHVVVGEEADSPSAISYITKGVLPEFKKYCPGCTVTTVDIPLNYQDIPSAVSTALNDNPSATYYDGEFEDQMQGALGGMQQAGKADSVKASFSTATLAGLQNMKSGNTVYAEMGVDIVYQGWADADEVLRMLVGQKVLTEVNDQPERLFTRSDIGSLSLISQAQASGQWFGTPNGFDAGFEKAWGLKK